MHAIHIWYTDGEKIFSNAVHEHIYPNESAWTQTECNVFNVHLNPDFLRHNFVFDGRGRVGARNNVPKSGRSDPRWTCIVPNTLLYSTHNVFYTTHFIVTNALYSTVRIVHFLNWSYFVKLTVLRLKMPFDFLSYFGFLANCLFLQH